MSRGVLLATFAAVALAAVGGLIASRGCADAESAPEVEAPTRPSARDDDAAPTIAAQRREVQRLRDTVDALERRLRTLERGGAPREPQETPDVDGSSFATPPVAEPAPDAEELMDLRARLLTGVATPEQSGRFWKLLRSDDLAPDTRTAGEPKPSWPDVWLPLDAPDATWSDVHAVADGSRGGAASFAAPTAHIDAGRCPVSSRHPFTVHAFLRTRESGFSTVLIVRDGEDVGLSLVLGRAPGCVSFEAWSWRTARLVSTTRVDDGAWHEVEATYDPATNGAMLYVDGRAEAAGVLGVGASLAGALRLGNNIGVDQPFVGDLDEVSILRRTTHAEAFGPATRR
jgi:hypothetical protein